MASTGTILIRVYTSQARLPVSGAMAAILRPETGGKTELLALRITDESGKTAPVRLATPGVETVQDVELIPLSRPETIGSADGETTHITPPNL